VSKVRAAKEKGNKAVFPYLHGCSSYPLIQIDPRKIVLPMLIHCKIGLINKVNRSFAAWVPWCIKKLDPPCHQVRQEYQDASMDKQKEAEDIARKNGRVRTKAERVKGSHLHNQKAYKSMQAETHT
jgi:hypothetical protein